MPALEYLLIVFLTFHDTPGVKTTSDPLTSGLHHCITANDSKRSALLQHTHTDTHTHAHTHMRTRTHAHTHTHTQHIYAQQHFNLPHEKHLHTIAVYQLHSSSCWQQYNVYNEGTINPNGVKWFEWFSLGGDNRLNVLWDVCQTFSSLSICLNSSSSSESHSGNWYTLIPKCSISSRTCSTTDAHNEHNSHAVETAGLNQMRLP